MHAMSVAASASEAVSAVERWRLIPRCARRNDTDSIAAGAAEAVSSSSQWALARSLHALGMDDCRLGGARTVMAARVAPFLIVHPEAGVTGGGGIGTV
jgi:hypothetical protein